MMKKRILALCLTVALLLGMIPVTSLAGTTETLEALLVENTADITVNGELTEGVWSKANSYALSGGFTAKISPIWGKNTLFLAVEYGTATSISITLGNRTWANIALSETVSVSGGAVTGVARSGVAELQIDLNKAGIVLTENNLTQNLSVSLSGPAGTASSGDLALSFSYKYVGSSDSTAVTFSELQPDPGSSFPAGSTGGTLKIEAATLDTSKLDHTKDMLLNVNMSITSMPEYTGHIGEFITPVMGYGYCMVIHHHKMGSSEPSSSFLLYNEGGKLYIKGYQGGVSLDLGVSLANVSAADPAEFLLGYAWNKDATVGVYVDGVYMGSLGMNQMDYCPAGGKVIHIRSFRNDVGSVDIAMSDATLETTLMGEHTHTPEEDDGDPETAIECTVCGVVTTLEVTNAYLVLNPGSITVDGVLGEAVWSTSSTKTLSGDISASVTSVWSKGVLYLALDYGSATEASITLGKKVWSNVSLGTAINVDDGALTGAAADGIAELKIDLSKAGIVLTDEKQFQDFNLTLTGDGTYATTGDISLVFANRIKKNISTPLTFASDYQENTIDSSQNGGKILWVNAPATSAVDRSKNMRLDMTLNITSMSTTQGNFTGAFHGNSMVIFMFGKAPNGETHTFPVQIYTDNGKNLKLRFYGGPGAGTSVDLGVEIGESFDFGYTWNTDNSADVYINGESKGHFDFGNASNAVSHTGWNGAPQIQIRCYNSEIQAKVSNASLSVADQEKHAHTPEEDDGDPETPIYCTGCGVMITRKPTTAVNAVLSGSDQLDDWDRAKKYWFNISNGLVENSVTALWKNDKLHLTVEHDTLATKLALTVGSKTWDAITLGSSITDTGLTGATVNGVTTLHIDLTAVGIVVEDYNDAFDFQVKLFNADNSKTAFLADAPVKLVLTGTRLVSQEASLTTTDDFGGVNTQILADTADKLWYITAGYPTSINHAVDMYVEASMKVTKLPVFEDGQNGAFFSGMNGYGISVTLWENDGIGGGNNAGYQSRGLIYNKGDGALAMKDFSHNEVDLGVKVGDTFKLKYVWNVDNSVDIYIDGELKGTLTDTYRSNVVLTTGANNLSFRAYTPVTGQNVEATVTGVKVGNYGEKKLSLAEEELSVSTVLSGVKLNSLTNDSTFTLPGSANTSLGKYDLEWLSGDGSIVLEKNGSGDYAATVTQPDSKENAYPRLTMIAKRQGGTGRTVVTWYVDASVIGLRFGEITAVTDLNAPFTAAGVEVDGILSDEGWNLDVPLLNNREVTGFFGAQWTTENLYLAVQDTNAENLNASDLTVVVNGITVPASACRISGNVAEMVISLEDLNVKLVDYGAKISASVTLGETQWSGNLVVTSRDWFGTDGMGERLPVNEAATVKYQGGAPTVNQGTEDLGNGWRIYDLYDPAGNNPTGVRSYVIFGAKENSPEEVVNLYANFDDRENPIYAEFEFLAGAMPVYDSQTANANSSNFSNYGLTWCMSHQEYTRGDTRYSMSVSMGIYNSEAGLVFCVLGEKLQSVAMNKYVGDRFRIGTAWHPDGSLVLYIDGEEYARFENAETEKKYYGSNLIIFNLIRNPEAATSGNESFDLYITNLSLGKTKGDCVLDQITEATVLDQNSGIYEVTEDLVLPNKLSDSMLGITDVPVVWQSSAPDVIATDGTVTRPAKGGRLVTLTANYNGHQRSFEVYVKGLVYESDVLVVESDRHPATGAGVLKDAPFFTFDADNNSLIYDLGANQKVNVITLTDRDDVNRLNESVMTIWVSDDNETYTRVESFKLLRDGRHVYLYDFEAECRYVKVHYTQMDADESDFTGSLEEMITASYQEIFGDGDGEFANSDTVTVTNDTDKKKWDDHYNISAAGIGTLKADKSDVRFLLGDELLYHYYNGNDFVVRIPEIEANSSVELTVLSGNAAAMNIDNKEYTLEVVYGTREDWYADPRWITGLPDGRMAGTYYTGTDNVFLTSSDGGITWTQPVLIEEALGWIHHVMGMSFDPIANRIFIVGVTEANFVISDKEASSGITRVIYSDDLGETWHRCPEFTVLGEQSKYYICYTEPKVVGSYDGAGPGVDLVFPLASQYDNDGSFCVRVAYSTDAGLTWTMGADQITDPDGEVVAFMEGGMSEASILEVDENGKLLVIARAQYDGVDVFMKSYSYDYGKTWETHAQLTNIYTTNTEPEFVEINGAQILTWAGNNVMGNEAMHRMPINVAITYDGGETYTNIQDLWSRTSFQNMTGQWAYAATNQSIGIVGDTVTFVFGSTSDYTMRLENFTDWFYRTKGVYDSFETSSAKAEGWSLVRGTVDRSDKYAADGRYSLQINRGASIVRSVPYLQTGNIEFEMYLDANSTANIQLQTAYSTTFGRLAPVALKVENGHVTYDGGSAPIKAGWNTFSIELDLTAETPVAKLYLNGVFVANVANAEMDDYICWMVIDAPSTVLYLDDVTVEDHDYVEVAEAPEDPDPCYFGHTPEAEDDDCTTPICCSVCGEVTTEGNAAHTGGTATCEHKAKCSVCGKEYGDLAAHKPEADDGDCTTDIKCSVCGEVTTEGNAAHSGGTATCEHKAKCSVCGKEYGDLAAHKPEADDGDCTTPIHCSVCDKEVEAGTSAHKGGTATCEHKAECSVCGKEYGNLAAHKPEADDGDCTTDIKCSVCGEVTTEGNEAHTGGTATCEHKAECSVCGKEYGDLAAHKPEADDGDCTTDIKCSVCGEVTTEGNAAHSGGTATCEHKAECSVCGKEYGDLAAHKPEADDGDCTTDIKCSVCGEVTTEGNEAHTGGTATCEHKAECSVCGTAYGDLAAHKGGTATCCDKAKCEVCGKEYGELNASNHTGEAKWSHTADKHSKTYECCGAIAVVEEAHSFTDNKCECGYEKPSSGDNSQTGDTTNLALALALNTLSVLALAVLLLNRKKWFA